MIAAITSCTNTSNPQVMVAAGLLAKKAVERGLERKPWVKSSLAPGSRVVTDYYERAGLTPYLEALGFHTVGYGCTTCIGNSGPLPEEISAAIAGSDLVACAVLSGNRNFEARIHPEVKANYLASPPLVVAYALAGRMDVDLATEPIGRDPDGARSTSATSGPRPEEIERDDRPRRLRRALPRPLRGRLHRRRDLAGAGDSLRESLRVGARNRRTSAGRRTSTGCRSERAAVEDIHGARCLVMLGDSVTTDHISPAGRDQAGQPRRAVPARARRRAARTSTRTARAAATTR